MVLLTMTPSIVEGLQTLDDLPLGAPAVEDDKTTTSNEPSLEAPTVGKPISHAQILDLWKKLRENDGKKYSLESLLRGACVYIPPPPPKPEPVGFPLLSSPAPPKPKPPVANLSPLQTPEYKALMARLRREEEARAYERMLNPLPPTETFSQRFPNAPTIAAAFAEVNRPHNPSDADMGAAEESEAAAFKEVNRQLMLVFNFFVSIVGVAATIWIAARWWNLTARVLVTLAGAILVGVAEVVVYSGYMWRMEQGASKDGKVKEVREVVNSWVIGRDGEADEGEKKVGTEPVTLVGKDVDVDEKNLRRRNKAKS
ncbi:hypothetical protein jhhlp_002962 [Lomentospora prolificans]|uniref:Endoplasmic reticulum-based factor for assembly of V-ATPase n=1 Tax=Lomentospora prolificans TaxID=41688 RepID=A0A2N3NFM2_9PEZI|nr:hypothetical protein jhhlp_002962 [Lomentospora prolificans]